jgi:glucose-6-phosphate 1-dehydrogenase
MKNEGLILVIFGASGDLTSRKLIPALCGLNNQNLLPDNFSVLGVGRSDMNDVQFRDKMSESIQKYLIHTPCASLDQKNSFVQKLNYISIDTFNSVDYNMLTEKLNFLDNANNAGGNYLFYLATPPSMYEIIIRNLGFQRLNKALNSKAWRRIVIEKPFGYSLETAQNLNSKVLEVFNEDQIYRIDHYLGKETVQNILVTRFSNGIFEPLWNRNYIDHVEITSSESIGVENRTVVVIMTLQVLCVIWFRIICFN